jgi:hypothetical protein
VRQRYEAGSPGSKRKKRIRGTDGEMNDVHRTRPFRVCEGESFEARQPLRHPWMSERPRAPPCASRTLFWSALRVAGRDATRAGVRGKEAYLMGMCGNGNLSPNPPLSGEG